MIILFVIALLAFFFCSRVLMRLIRFYGIINELPGPPAIPLFGSVFQFHLDRIAFIHQMRAVWLSYQSLGIFRVWVGFHPYVCLPKWTTTQPVLHSHEILTKSSAYNFLETWLGTGLLISTGDKWRSRRKLLTGAFHFAILKDFIHVFNAQALILVDELSRFANESIHVDIFPYMGRCALDIICETAMGATINAQRDHQSKYVSAVNKITEIQFHYERKPWLWVKPIFFLLGYGFEYKRCLKVLKGFTNRVIKERIEEYSQSGHSTTNVGDNGGNEKKHKPLLDLLLSEQEEHQLSLEDIREEVDTFMFEGHDTTASGLSWTIFLLGHHPDVQEKVAKEMEDIFGPSQRMPNADDMKQMKYLECVIKESLRLYPPVPLIGRRTTDDFFIGDHTIPSGCSVMVSPFISHRDKTIFGPDTHEFRPERFDELADILAENPYAYIPFSAGPRNCIGQRFAMMEEKVVLSTLIRRFKFVSVDPIDEMVAVPDVILRPSGPMNIRFSPRP